VETLKNIALLNSAQVKVNVQQHSVEPNPKMMETHVSSFKQ
jgi:hypothetical protein